MGYVLKYLAARPYQNYQPVQPQKQAREWKFWILKVEELYYPCSENKDADQLRGYRETAKLISVICGFVFAYVNFWVFHARAHIKTLNGLPPAS